MNRQTNASQSSQYGTKNDSTTKDCMHIRQTEETSKQIENMTQREKWGSMGDTVRKMPSGAADLIHHMYRRSISAVSSRLPVVRTGIRVYRFISLGILHVLIFPYRILKDALPVPVCNSKPSCCKETTNDERNKDRHASTGYDAGRCLCWIA